MAKGNANVEVRYVPAICGSPGWMSRAAAERELAREMDTIDLLAACGAAPVGRPYIYTPPKGKVKK